MNITLEVWRQKNKDSKGEFHTYEVEASEHMSFLEMLDVLNARLESQGIESIYNHPPVLSCQTKSDQPLSL